MFILLNYKLQIIKIHNCYNLNLYHFTLAYGQITPPYYKK